MSDTSIRTCLRLEHWPDPDRLLWERITTFDTILDDGLMRAALWRAPTRQRVIRCYGRWLSFLIAHGELDPAEEPARRITLDRVRPYVGLLQEQVTPWTAWSYTLSLWCMARNFAPEQDWEWLYRIVAKLQIRRYPHRDKRSRMLKASSVVTWATAELGRLNTLPSKDTQTALAYRNALMVAMLIHCPLRLRNLTMIRISRHIRLIGDRYSLHFEPGEVKTNRFLSMMLPAELTSFIRDWLETWRPLLLRQQNRDAFWVGIRGTPMKERGIYGCVVATTEAAFGVPINPHLFRDIAASWVVDMTPENAGVAGTILGHINPATTEDHYIHASQSLAGERYRNSVDTLRRTLTTSYKDPFKHRRRS
jgi:integrase